MDNLEKSLLRPIPIFDKLLMTLNKIKLRSYSLLKKIQKKNRTLNKKANKYKSCKLISKDLLPEKIL